MGDKDTTRDPITVGVFTPYLQGHFFGELVTQLQQYCLLKGYRFSLIKTGGHGEYRSLLHTRHIDFFVVLRNAVHPSLLEQLLEQGKYVVSVAYDYFPLNVPLVVSDNAFGVELAVNHLLKQGHRQLAYVGNLTNYDVRKRYEAFCDQLEINRLPQGDDCIFTTEDELFTGGFKAANQFIRDNSPATGVICGGGLTGIGFARQFGTVVPHRVESMDIVCFDAVSLIDATEPELHVIDLNLHLLAFKALQVLESLHQGNEVDRCHLVEPKIMTRANEYRKSEEAFLATSTEVAELMNGNYMKGMLDYLYEWPKTIVESQLDDIMMLGTVFPRHMAKACYARVARGKEGKEYLKVTKVMGALGATKTSATDMKTLSTVAAYPPASSDLDLEKLQTAIHLPLYRDNSLWAVISIFGRHTPSGPPSSLRGLFAYLDQIVTRFEARLQLSGPGQGEGREAHEASSPQQASVTGRIFWEPESKYTEWDDAALTLLGVESDLEKGIYRNMDLADCVPNHSASALQGCLLRLPEEGFSIDIELRHRDRSYKQYHLMAEPESLEGRFILQITSLDIAI